MDHKEAVQFFMHARAYWGGRGSGLVPPVPSDADAQGHSEFVKFVTSHLPLIADIPFEDAMRGMMVLKQRGEWLDVAQLRAALTQSESAEIAWHRVAEAVDLHRRMQREGSPTPNYEFTDEGDVIVRPPEHQKSWRQITGPDIAGWIDARGGINAVAGDLANTALRAEFRRWWDSQEERRDRRAATEIADRALTALEPGSATPEVRALPAHDDRA